MYRDIMITGSIGESGAFRLAGGNEDKIRERFPEHILKGTELFSDRSGIGSKTITCAELKDVIGKYNTGGAAENTVIAEVGERGLMAALWDLGEDIRLGFVIDAEKIPVSQLTVEICELFGEDPFKMRSEGCFLICTDKGNELCEKFRAQSIPAVIIGHSVPQKGKVMVMGEITRYIDKPRPE